MIKLLRTVVLHLHYRAN